MKRVFLFVLLMVFCKKPFDLKVEEAKYDAYLAALPELRPVPKDKPVELAVHYVKADNLPELDVNERTRLYRLVEKLCAEKFGYTVQIREARLVKIRDFFASASSLFTTSPLGYPSQAFLVSYFAPDRDTRIEAAVAAAIKGNRAKVKEYLGDGYAALYTRAFVGKLSAIFAETDTKGNQLLSKNNAEDEKYFSYGHWSSILQGEKQADFFLTNAGIIGADNGMPLYVIARGGITSAFIENNAHRPYQGVGVLGLYPFLADTAYFNEKRGKLTREEKIEAIAWIWLHELGHLLMKKEENYSFTDSVHRAPPDLRYYEWVKRVRDTKDHRSAAIAEMKKF